MRTNVRTSVEWMDRPLYFRWGLGIQKNSGSMGSTYQEPGKDMFWEVRLFFLWWIIRISSYWKEV